VACPYASEEAFVAVIGSLEKGIRTASSCHRLRLLHDHLLDTFGNMERARGCTTLDARLEGLNGLYNHLLVHLCVEVPRAHV
jgi:hypothetical protein